uniref:Uncharacterized protein n=1 Tax=Panagrolaimus superbus TaxID=310955 RepID=A0A914XQK3_9BILA
MLFLLKMIYQDKLRLTSADITEEDFAFLKSKNKVLCNLEECSIKSNFSPSIYSSSSSNSQNSSPIFLSPFPPNPIIRRDLSQSQHPRKRVPNRSNAKKIAKISPLIKRTYRKSYNHNNDENFPKIIVPRPRKQPPPLRVSSLDISRGFVGFCGVLNVNPYYAGCPGRITTTKDVIGHTYFICANCGTRRRYLEESSSKTNVLNLE